MYIDDIYAPPIMALMARELSTLTILRDSDKRRIDTLTAELAAKDAEVKRLQGELAATGKRGNWIMNAEYPDTHICTSCRSRYDVFRLNNETRYCPNCGSLNYVPPAEAPDAALPTL